MPRHRRLVVIAKERPFDAAQWTHLLRAFAYVLHEQRQQRAAALPATQTPPQDQP